MGILKKPKIEQYVPPKMADLSAEYRERCERLQALHTGLGRLRQEHDQLERQLADTPAPVVRPGVAKLLGDETVDERVSLRARLEEVKRSITDHEHAIDLQQARIREARVGAATLVLDEVKPEYGRRVAALAKALEAAAAAREDLYRLTSDLEADDVPWLRLGVFNPSFLGDRQDGHVQRFVREAKEAGYYVD